MFLHGGVLHWLVNSWAIFQLGSLYEVLFGSKRFALVYFVSGLAASIASSVHGTAMSVGASGAVFGIMGAFIFSILRSPRYRHQPWVRGLVGQIVFWIILNLAIGASVKVIDNGRARGRPRGRTAPRVDSPSHTASQPAGFRHRRTAAAVR